MDGLFGLALSPPQKSNDVSNSVFGTFNSRQSERNLYFHALASGHENVVPLRIINNETIWTSDVQAMPRAFAPIGLRGIQTPGKRSDKNANWGNWKANFCFNRCKAEAMDSNGNLFFVLVNPLALACWDSSTPYSTDNIKIVLQNDATLQFASGLKVIRNLDGVEELWVATNRFQVWLTAKSERVVKQNDFFISSQKTENCRWYNEPQRG